MITIQLHKSYFDSSNPSNVHFKPFILELTNFIIKNKINFLCKYAMILQDYQKTLECISKDFRRNIKSNPLLKNCA